MAHPYVCPFVCQYVDLSVTCRHCGQVAEFFGNLFIPCDRRPRTSDFCKIKLKKKFTGVFLSVLPGILVFCKKWLQKYLQGFSQHIVV